MASESSVCHERCTVSILNDIAIWNANAIAWAENGVGYAPTVNVTSKMVDNP
jgi:hypothetical protein